MTEKAPWDTALTVISTLKNLDWFLRYKVVRRSAVEAVIKV